MRRAILALLVLLIGGVLAVAIWPPLHTSFRTRLVTSLQQHFKGEVTLGSLEVSLFPQLKASGTKLVIKRPDPADAPLLSVESFEITGAATDLVRRVLRLRSVAVEGLQIRIPPRRQRSGSAPVARLTRSALVIDELFATGTSLVIETDKPDRDPLVFDIQKLHLERFAFDRPTRFETTIINPVPPGEVVARGEFGPWQPDEPRTTPVSGEYTLRDADLSVFDGLAGRLSSVGRFKGPLERLVVSGTTTTPDFLLTKTGQPVLLDTAFDAVVDGTNGDTILDRVTATLLATTIESKGRVVRVSAPQRGRLIEMDVRIPKGRLEDIMKLALKENPAPMLGALDLNATMRLAPGKGEVIRRLELDGRFAVRAGRFSSSQIQRKLSDLSRRGRGEPEAPLSDRVFSDLSASFRLKDGRLALPALAFHVEGAQINLAGRYGVLDEQLDFDGMLRLDARLSETVTGFKSWLLKVVDPLFKGKKAGTELPIHVRGPVQKPEFGVNIKKALLR